MLDETTSWYSLPNPDAIPITEDEATGQLSKRHGQCWRRRACQTFIGMKPFGRPYISKIGLGEKVLAQGLYSGYKPNLKHLRIFGSIAYVHVLDETRKKLDAKSEKCIMVGYSYEQKGYKCYNPGTKQVRVS